MIHRMFLTALLATSFLAQFVASFEPAKSVIPLVGEGGLPRRGRDLLLADEDDDFDFFHQEPLDLKLDDYEDVLMEADARQRTAGGPSVDSNQVKVLLAKLQLKSNQFMDIARETAHSAVSLLASCARLVENSDDNFVIMAH
nr:uncharacterized protein LOC109399276 [Aedes albopictus]